jgi:sec-independent protein translocase protein TatA
MSFRPGPLEIFLILVIVLIIFGVGRLTDVGGAMGKAIREFRKAQSDDDDAQLSSEEEAPVSTNRSARH